MTSPTPEQAALIASASLATQVRPISLAQYWNAQARVSRQMVDLAASAVRRYGMPTTAPDRKAMAARVHPLVERARRQSYVLAVQNMADTAPYVKPAPLRPYPVDAVETAIADVVDEVQAAARKPSVRVVDRNLDQVSQARAKKPRVRVGENLGARLARHADQAGRDAVQDTAEAAGDAIGWARVLSGAENCTWCVMLASRGPVYGSEFIAVRASGRRGNRKRGEEYHDHCDCRAVLVQKGREWDGREQYELLEDLWGEATRGHYGKHALNALRRQLYRAERDGLSHQELLDALRDENREK